MANGVVKDKKLKRSLKDDNESRSVKRKTAHELQEIGDKRNDIGFFLINTAEGKLLLNILNSGKAIQCACVRAVRYRIAESVQMQVIAALVKKQTILQYMSIVYYSTDLLEQKFSGETLLENSRCRFCADAPSCPLQPQNIIFTELPANRNSENVNEEERTKWKHTRPSEEMRSYIHSKPVGTIQKNAKILRGSIGMLEAKSGKRNSQLY